MPKINLKSKSTDFLLNVILIPEGWSNTSLEIAKNELQNRGYTLEQLLHLKREFDAAQEEQRVLEFQRRSVKTYSYIELIFMALNWPITILHDWHLKKEGFTKLHEQRIYSIIIGVVIWLSFFIWVDQSYNQTRITNEISLIDVYEWELETYTPDEIRNIRKRSLNQALDLIAFNQQNGLPTRYVKDGVDLSIDSVQKLNKVDLFKVRQIEIIKKTNNKEVDKIIVRMAN